MKKLIFTTVIMLLASCFGTAKFDASSEATIKESTQKIVDVLPEDQREDFNKALMYFIAGGESGLESIMYNAFIGKSSEAATEVMLIVNLKAIDGLTGEQILEKYRTSIEQDRIKREKIMAEKEKKAAEQEKVSSLEEEAQELLKSNKFEEALKKYKVMNEISSGLEAAEAGIEETTEAMERFTEKMNYMDKVEITEFLAERIDTYSKKGVPAVRISLKNKGDRSLDKVKVIVYFQDKDGSAIFEKEFLPVFVSEYSLSGDNNPLKPGYVKEMEKDKYHTIESTLSDWQEGKAIAKVVDIEFTK